MIGWNLNVSLSSLKKKMMRGQQHTISLLILLFPLTLHSQQQRHPLPILVNNVQTAYRPEEHGSPLSFCRDVEAESPSSCADTILRGMESYNRDPPVDVVYVIHYEPYSKRRETLAKTLREMGLLERTFWISSPDPPDLEGETCDVTVSNNKNLQCIIIIKRLFSYNAFSDSSSYFSSCDSTESRPRAR